jgi:PQQ enzyme repeat
MKAFKKLSPLPIVLALAAPSLALANADLEKLIDNPKNWAMQAGNMENHRYSQLKQINKANVKNMKVAWMFSTGVLRGHEGSPLVIGDMMYLHSAFPNKVFAMDLNTQKIVWKYEPKQDPAVIPQMCCDTVNRGLAYGDGKICNKLTPTWSRSMRRPVKWFGRLRMAIRSWAWLTPTHLTYSKIKSSPVFPVVSGACAVTSTLIT